MRFFTLGLLLLASPLISGVPRAWATPPEKNSPVSSPVPGKKSSPFHLHKPFISRAFDLPPELRQWAIERRYAKRKEHTEQAIREIQHSLSPDWQEWSGTGPFAVRKFKPDPSVLPRLQRRLQRLGGQVKQQSRMPAFERLVQQQAHAQPLKNVFVVSDLHITRSSRDLFEALIDSGILEHNIILQGVRHSQQPEVMEDLHYDDGIAVRAARLGRKKQEYQHLVKLVIKRARENKEAKFLVLGHGGILHSLLHRQIGQPGVPADLQQRIVVLETTHKGELRMNRMRQKLRGLGGSAQQLRTQFPYLDIGDFWGKTVYESPVIGWSCARSMDQYLQDLNRRGLKLVGPGQPQNRVLIVGHGNVGRQTALVLQRMGYEVGTFDKVFQRGTVDFNARRERRGHKDGIKVFQSLAEAMAWSPHVVGSATGEPAFNEHNLHLIKNSAVFFNLASPGEMSGIIAHAPPRSSQGGALQFDGRRLTLLPVSEDHQDQVRMINGKEILLARGDQVINLAYPVTHAPEYFQVTRGLTYLLAIKGVKLFGQKPRRYFLEDRLIKGFIADIEADLSSRGFGPLRAPAFPPGWSLQEQQEGRYGL